MKELLRVIAVIGVLFFASSCSDKKDETGPEIQSFKESAYVDLNAKISQARLDKVRKIALKGYSKQDNLKLDSALAQAQGGLESLLEGSDRYSAYVRIGSALKSIENLKILEIDQSRLDDIFNELRAVYYDLGKELKLPNFQKWNLYNYNFGGGIEPEFNTYGSRSNWGYNIQTDIPKAQVGAAGGANAWLVSRAFNLSEIESSSFRFKTAIILDSKDPNINRKKALEEHFKVYVILNPDPLENLSTWDDSRLEKSDRIIRIKYSADDMPLGERFHKKWVPSVDLIPYKGIPLAIAFRFNPPRGPQQYFLWQILDFEINGAGRIQPDLLKHKTLFTGDSFPAGFHKISLLEQGKVWRPASHNNNSFAIAEKGSKSSTLLLTPKYYIDKNLQMASLSVEHVFNRESFEQNAFNKMQILVSKEFKGGNPTDTHWSVLDYSGSLKPNNGANWQTVKSKNIDLSEYIGEEVTFAFRYASEMEDLHTWQINGFTISALGKEPVGVLNYNLGCFIKDPDQEQIFYSFDLDENSDKETSTKNISGTPARWGTNSKDDGACLPKSFYNISAHSNNGDKLGETRKILPVIDLTSVSKASLRILHSLRFWALPETTEIQLSVEGSDQWETVVFPAGVFADQMENMQSPWVSIPANYIGKKVLVGLKYKGFQKDGQTYKPNWSFKKLEVKEDL